MVASLEKAGYRTVGDLARADLRDLADRFGAYGLRLQQLSRGEDARAVDPDGSRKTISAENTFFDDLSTIPELEDELWPLCDRVARKLREEGIAGRVATLKLRTTDFRIITRRRTLPVPIQTARTLFSDTRELLSHEMARDPYRLIGAGLSDFVNAEEAASDFFAGEERRALSGEKAMDKLRARYGAQAVVSGRALKRKS